MADLANVPVFEQAAASLGTLIQAVREQIHHLSVLRYSNDNGAGYEALYGALATPDTKPAGGNITKAEMQAYIGAVNSIMTAIDNASSGVADVAEFDVNLLNNA